MGAVSIEQRPALFPGHTVWKSTAGPVAFVGFVIPGNDKKVGVAVYVNEREFNEIRHAFGYPSKEQFADLAEELAAAQQRAAELEQQLAEALDHQVKVVPIGDVRQAVDERLEELATPVKESHVSR